MSLEFNGEVLVPDLGADKIWRIVNTGSPGNFRVQGQINIQPGTGPRHIAIHGKMVERCCVSAYDHSDNILFTLHETASTLTAQLIPPAPNGTTLPLIANVSVVPSNPLPGSQFAAAEILISTPTDQFPDPLIYVSNRNIGNVTDPNGDTIAIFQFINGTADTVSKKRMVRRPRNTPQTGTLQLLAQVPTGLQQIRSMTLGKVQDGGDHFIIAGANTQGGVAIFRRIDGGKNLTLVARNEDIANRTSFVFV